MSTESPYENLDLTNPDLPWEKSPYSSNGGNGNCVEIAELGNGLVGLRDTKDRTRPAFAFNETELLAFGLWCHDRAKAKGLI